MLFTDCIHLINERPRLELRPLREKDAPALEALRCGYAGFRDEWLYPNTAAEFIAGSIRAATAVEGVWFGVWLGRDLTGVIGLHLCGEATARIDYLLAPPFRGKRIATRCAVAVTQRAFAEGARRLEIRCDAANAASCRVAARAGFVRKALSAGVIDYGLERGDLVVYVAEAGSWRAPHRE